MRVGDTDFSAPDIQSKLSDANLSFLKSNIIESLFRSKPSSEYDEEDSEENMSFSSLLNMNDVFRNYQNSEDENNFYQQYKMTRIVDTLSSKTSAMDFFEFLGQNMGTSRFTTFSRFFLSQETSDKIGRGMAGWGDLAKDLSIDGASAEFFDFVRNQLDQVQMEKYLQDRGFSQGKVTSLLQDMEYTQGVSRMDSIYFRK